MPTVRMQCDSLHRKAGAPFDLRQCLVLCAAILLTGCSPQVTELISIKESPTGKGSGAAAEGGFNWLPLGDTLITNVQLGAASPLLAAPETLQISSQSGAAVIIGMFEMNEPVRGPLVFNHDGELNLRCKFQCADKPRMAPVVLDVGMYALPSGPAAGESPRGGGYRLQLPLKGGYSVLLKEFSGASLASEVQNSYRLGGELGEQLAALDDREHELHFRLQATNRTVLISSYLDGVLLHTGIDTPGIDGKHDEPGSIISFNAVTIALRGDVSTKLRVIDVALAADEVLPAMSEKLLKICSQGLLAFAGSAVLLFSAWITWRWAARKASP